MAYCVDCGKNIVTGKMMARGPVCSTCLKKKRVPGHITGSYKTKKRRGGK